MNIRQIFLPFLVSDPKFTVPEAYSTFDEFISLLKSTHPDFDERTDWNDLNLAERSGIILQFSIIARMEVSDVNQRILQMIFENSN